MSYTITEQIHISMTVGEEAVEFDFAPGVVDLPDTIADILVAQGFAAPATGKTKTTKTSTDTVSADSATTPTEG